MPLHVVAGFLESDRGSRDSGVRALNDMLERVEMSGLFSLVLKVREMTFVASAHAVRDIYG